MPHCRFVVPLWSRFDTPMLHKCQPTLRGGSCHPPPVRAGPPRFHCRQRLRVTAVLEKDDVGSLYKLKLKADADKLEALLPPSLSTSSSSSAAEVGLVSPGQGSGQPQLSCSEDQVFYYAYGANLSLACLKRRGVDILDRSPGVIVDRSVKLVFKHRGGYSTLQQVQPNEGVKYTPYMGHVHGVLYLMEKKELKKLSKVEGGYQLVDIEVETYDGLRATAKTFVSGPLAQLHAEVVPTERYMKQLRDGAADNYLDPLYQAWLSSIETVPSVGLGPEYFDTPAKYIAYSFLAIVALLVVGFFPQH